MIPLTIVKDEIFLHWANTENSINLKDFQEKADKVEMDVDLGIMKFVLVYDKNDELILTLKYISQSEQQVEADRDFLRSLIKTYKTQASFKFNQTNLAHN